MKRMVDINDVLGYVGLKRKGDAGDLGLFFFGLGVGIAGGCVATLLLAPTSGTEAREKLLRVGEDLSKTVQGKVGEISRGFSQRPGNAQTFTEGSTRPGI